MRLCGGALTFRLDLALLARRQREDEVDLGGLDVRGRGECPDPAARYPGRKLGSHIVALLPVGTTSTMAQTGVSGLVVVDGESFMDALFASAGQG